MRLRILLVPGLLCLCTPGPAAERTPVYGLPPDVADFMGRRELCEHFRGEEAYNRERRRFLEENMKKYCAGTDRELVGLKEKYRNNDAVVRALTDYEDTIEWGE